ncbi:hypothetical protein Hanom_Chr06g00551971 [Helianthus anomalus]
MTSDLDCCLGSYVFCISNKNECLQLIKELFLDSSSKKSVENRWYLLSVAKLARITSGLLKNYYAPPLSIFRVASLSYRVFSSVTEIFGFSLQITWLR